MGKLKFTFTNLWFWITLLLVSFLTEDLNFMTDNPKGGFDVTTLIVITLACLICLSFFYLIQHKENKIKLDFVLLPAFVIVGIAFIVSIWLNQGQTFAFENGEGEVTAVITTYDRVKATIILIVFLSFLYAMIFMVNVNNPRSRRYYWLVYAGVLAALISLVYSLITEFNEYKSIFINDGEIQIVIDSFYGNKNYYGGILFIGFLSCIIANYYKPRCYLYVLMVVFFVAILTCASMLPTIISGVALIIYLFEEIIRFAVKRRYVKSGFAVFSLLLTISLIVILYIGCVKEWKGFNGLNNYLGDLIKSKDFSTFTGRVKIWVHIAPYLFDNKVHTIIGHGFMISEKSILAITAAFNNDALSGVRTTHNGYIQILFEYGLVGFVAHMILVCYFIYACIRLMLEKRFHFAFVYGFVALCCGVYNCCESSSFFDAGVKEIFMTMMFMVPVMTECKFYLHSRKVKELKNIEVPEKMDPVKLGKGISFVIMSVIVMCVVALVCPITYQYNWLKYLIFNLIGGLSILLIFVPYMVSLYYRTDERIFFIAHCALNAIGIVLFTFIGYFILKYTPTTKDLAPYLTPALLFVLLALDALIYSFVKKGKFSEWRAIFISGSFINSVFAIAGGLSTGILAFVIIQNITKMNLFLYPICIVFALFGFYGAFYFAPTQGGREFLEEYNNMNMLSIRNLVRKDEKYYG